MKQSTLERTRQRLLKPLDVLRQKLQHRRLPLPSQRELDLIEVFRSRIRNLTIPEPSGNSAAQQSWHNNMVNLQELALGTDPRNFLSWEVVGSTMFVKYAKYSRTEFRYLQERPDRMRWLSALKEINTGNPVKCPFEKSTSCNLLHHAYHVARFESETGKRADSFRTIVEFGGGYGSMCRLFFNLNFSGRYLIFDLPPFSALQQYFLQSAGISLLLPEDYLEGKSGVLCISDIDILDRLVAHEPDNLFLATWSISETPINVRKRILDRNFTAFSDFLIAYQPAFGEVDNEKYFGQLCQTQPDIQWSKIDIEHLPGQKYLFGSSTLNQ